MHGPLKLERFASGFKVFLNTDRIGKLTVAFSIRFDIDGNDGLITDVPIRRRSVILDIEIAIIAVGQCVGYDFNLVATCFVDVPATTVTDGSADEKAFKTSHDEYLLRLGRWVKQLTIPPLVMDKVFNQTEELLSKTTNRFQLTRIVLVDQIVC